MEVPGTTFLQAGVVLEVMPVLVVSVAATSEAGAPEAAGNRRFSVYPDGPNSLNL